METIKEKLEKFLDEKKIKVSIVGRVMDSRISEINPRYFYKYFVQIGNQSFEYSDSIANYEEENRLEKELEYLNLNHDVAIYRATQRLKKGYGITAVKKELKKIKDDVIIGCMRSLVQDLYLGVNSEEILDILIGEYGYEYKEAKKYVASIKLNNEKMLSLFNEKDIKFLQELLQDY